MGNVAFCAELVFRQIVQREVVDGGDSAFKSTTSDTRLVCRSTPLSLRDASPTEGDHALLGRIVQDASLAQHETNPLSNHVIFCAKQKDTSKTRAKSNKWSLCGVALNSLVTHTDHNRRKSEKYGLIFL